MTNLYYKLSSLLIYKHFLSAFLPLFMTYKLADMTHKIESFCELYAINLCTML